MNSKYIKPKSVSWWSGLLLAVAVPLCKYIGIDLPDNITEILVERG